MPNITWDASRVSFPVEDLFESVNDREIRQVFEGQTQIHLEIKQLHRQLAMILDEQRRYVALITEEVTKKGTAAASGQVRMVAGGRMQDAERFPQSSPPFSSPSFPPPAGRSRSAAAAGLRLVDPAGSPQKPERAEVRDKGVVIESLLVFSWTKLAFVLAFFFFVKMDFLRKTSEIPSVKPCK